MIKQHIDFHNIRWPHEFRKKKSWWQNYYNIFYECKTE